MIIQMNWCTWIYCVMRFGNLHRTSAVVDDFGNLHSVNSEQMHFSLR